MTTKDTAPNAVPALRNGAELELAFTDLLANGQGVGRAAGIVVFCFGPLPGELARVRVTEVKQRYAVAEKLEILRETPQRADPFCPVFGRCGGCQIQHLSYPAQLTWKRDVVRETMHRIGGIEDPNVRETIGATDPRAYRNKMSLVVDASADPPALGFYQQRTHEVVAIDGCPVVAPLLDALLRRLDALRGTESVKLALREARHLIARASSVTNESVLTITTARRSEAVARAAHDLRREIPGLAGVTNSFDLSNENAILGRRHRVLAGRGEIEESIGGVRYRVSPASFFQVNVEMVGRIFDTLEPWLQGARRIVDLYCGVGTFSLFFAKFGCRIYGIEENAVAVAEAVANARLNELHQSTRFTAGRVERLAETLRGALRKSDVVFLDPPRKGCDETTLAQIADARVRNVWYLSCDPATLARDSKFLVAKGYRLDSLQPFDMFPQTGHVETLARLEYS